MISAGLDEIKISFDGANEEEFQRIRAPLKYTSVVENVINLVRIRNEMGRDQMKIQVTCSSTTDKDQTMAALSKYVDGFSFGKLHNWASWDSQSISVAHRKQGNRKPCARIWQTFTILSTWQVALCCLDYNGSVIVGDLRDQNQSIAKIWQGDGYRRIRNLHRKSRQDQIAVCASCAKSYW